MFAQEIPSEIILKISSNYNNISLLLTCKTYQTHISAFISEQRWDWGIIKKYFNICRIDLFPQGHTHIAHLVHLDNCAMLQFFPNLKTLRCNDNLQNIIEMDLLPKTIEEFSSFPPRYTIFGKEPDFKKISHLNKLRKLTLSNMCVDQLDFSLLTSVKKICIVQTLGEIYSEKFPPNIEKIVFVDFDRSIRYFQIDGTNCIPKNLKYIKQIRSRHTKNIFVKKTNIFSYIDLSYFQEVLQIWKRKSNWNNWLHYHTFIFLQIGNMKGDELKTYVENSISGSNLEQIVEWW